MFTIVKETFPVNMCGKNIFFYGLTYFFKSLEIQFSVIIMVEKFYIGMNGTEIKAGQYTQNQNIEEYFCLLFHY